MTNEIIFTTQLASIIAFILTIFVLYRLLVSNKDAIIQLLEEKNTYLKERLIDANENTPDKLAKNLSERVNLLTEELDRLSKDQENNKEIILQKEKMLHLAQEDFVQLKKQLEEAQEIASEYFCPHCKAMMVERAYHDESSEFGDINHEYLSFECGLTIVDGKVEHPCKNQT